MPSFPALDRLIRKEVALGTLRELTPPQDHIGLSLLAPWMEVASDDVIFDYAKGLTDGLVNARAEDAESELAQKDSTFVGTGRASVIDWALKDYYTASDVTRYNEQVMLEQRLGSNVGAAFPLAVGNMAEDFRKKIARDDALRRKKIDNRLEWLCMTSLDTSGIAYNDGKIKFTINWGRPAGQTDQAPGSGNLWSTTLADPIGDIIAVQNYMYDTYGVHMTRAIASRKVILSLLNSDRFAARSGLAGATGGLPIDPMYLIDGWGPEAAKQVIERATNLSFIEYDSVYRTRPIGSNTVTNNRFLSDKKVYLLPDPNDVSDLDDAIGFGKMLTSPHPEGNWTPGYYEFEYDQVDPWGKARGTGVKAFPVFPHMDLTYTMTVLP